MTATLHDHLRQLDPATLEATRPFLEEPSADPWIRDVLRAYYAYFWRVLREGVPPRPAEARLLEDLARRLPDATEIETAERALAEEFGARGYRFLGGYTAAYLGPYVWKHTERAHHTVELPDRTVEVDVFSCAVF
ncbi:hypothetical protein HNR42_002299 [Deinobacterium chartae]|uniref:Uncharacterized protein n=1 Tax=Deinobacterium chartae TaxID=521158 RepID=A0A841I1K0_9DEIO|nr:hypothetical protein [Deinobacterium chartae]MBB6098864.1 hypothetical protein [Deinobacterium chartae]